MAAPKAALSVQKAEPLGFVMVDSWVAEMVVPRANGKRDGKWADCLVD
jgi:hypothetical protein